MWLLVAQAACGEVIQLQAAMLRHGNAGASSILFILRNSGDEAARAIRIEGRLAGVSLVRELPDLEPDSEQDAEFDFPASAMPRGLHAAEFLIRYHDANGYPFSSPQAVLVDRGAPAPAAEIAAHVEPLVLADTGRLRLWLTLPEGASPVNVRVRILAPDELVCEAPDRTLALFPGRPVLVEAAVSNRSGRAGSDYPVFAVVSATHTNGVLESLAEGRVRVKGGGLGDYSWPPAALGAAVILLTAFFLAQRKGGGERAA
ncbi:MAG: hypothetical protein R6X19_00715 [Kiritimatiellia bacterium]